jgi:hypothetical protein
MTFYDKWIQSKNTEQEKEYIRQFLEMSPESIKVLREGNEAELGAAISVITSVPMEKYFDIVDILEYKTEVNTSQVPQFSFFDAAAFRLPEILEFAPEGLSYKEIGYQLAKSPTAIAGTKYGENHSKLASMMELVEINCRPSNVVSTALGRYLIAFMKDEKKELLRRLILRQYIIRKLIHDTSIEPIQYKDVVIKLSEATAIRRRNNVRLLLELVLQGSEEEKRLGLIDWRVSEKEFEKRGI